MLYAVFLASLGTLAGSIAFLFWQARRSERWADYASDRTSTCHELSLQLIARGRAVEDRDRVIDYLNAERARLESALAEVTKQRDSLVANIKDPDESVRAMRNALGGVRVSKTTTPAPAKTR